VSFFVPKVTVDDEAKAWWSLNMTWHDDARANLEMTNLFKSSMKTFTGNEDVDEIVRRVIFSLQLQSKRWQSFPDEALSRSNKIYNVVYS